MNAFDDRLKAAMEQALSVPVFTGVSKYRGEGDYLPGWDDRKELASLWQHHAPLPAEGLSEAVYDALIAVANWGYEQRRLESK